MASKLISNKLPWIAIGIIAVIAILYGSVTSLTTKDIGTETDNFAKCLTEKGAVMYGAYWCPHCKEQKKMFGNAFEYINYIECTEDKQACMEAAISGYPTWIIAGEKYPGKQSFERLSSITDCKPPKT